jgi:hypothetical protein
VLVGVAVDIGVLTSAAGALRAVGCILPDLGQVGSCQGAVTGQQIVEVRSDVAEIGADCLRGGCRGNTRDFRCLWCSGVLPLWCSVPVFESGFVVPPLECGHVFGPRVAAGMARGSTVRGPGGRGGFSFLTGSAAGRGLCEAGREYSALRFPGDGLLGRGGVPEFRAGFLGAL